MDEEVTKLQQGPQFLRFGMFYAQSVIVPSPDNVGIQGRQLKTYDYNLASRVRPWPREFQVELSSTRGEWVGPHRRRLDLACNDGRGCGCVPGC